MSSSVKEIYDAKYSIRRNRSLIFSAMVAQDLHKARRLERENDALRTKILRKYAIILD